MDILYPGAEDAEGVEVLWVALVGAAAVVPSQFQGQTVEFA